MNDTQDNKWDKLLHIKTMGRDDSQSDLYRYPYEPTPYSVLQIMAVVKEGQTFSYPTRQDAVASELNMTNAFMRK